MIKASAIMEAVKSGLALSQNVQSSLSGQFAAATETMNLSGGNTAGSVADQSGAACKNMVARMEDTFAALKKDLHAHQQMQQRAVPEEFTVSKPDLRDKPAHGFPGEDPDYPGTIR